MPNSLEYAKKFLPIIDEIYKYGSYTAGLDAATRLDFTGVNEVKVLKVSTTGLGNYSRTDGYPKGDITASWETMKLEIERGKELAIDRMDNEEVLGMVFGTVTGSFMREHVIPEMDAYRFSKYASAEGITAKSENLTKSTIVSAIDEAVRQMNADEVPTEGRKLYVNSNLQPLLNNALSRTYGSENSVSNVLTNYNGIPITYVPPTRFYSGITLNDGSENWGFKPTAGQAPLNFMLLYGKAGLQVQKFALPKIFSPDVNQDKDAWKFQFRLFHDALVYENKAKGIYVHKSSTVVPAEAPKQEE